MRLLRTILLISATLGSVYMLTGCQESKTTKLDQKPITKVAEPVEQVQKEEVAKPVPAPKPKVELQEKAVTTVEKEGRSKIVFAKTSHDFGVMVPDKYYDTEYKFKNAGTSELIIERTNSTCGCTVPKLEKKNYAPGESGSIKVKYRASKTAGKVNKHIEVYSNDPVTPMVKCYVKGSVELAVTVQPKTLKFSLKKENAGAVPIVIKSTTGKPFSISQIRDVTGTISFDFDPEQKATEFSLTPKIDIEKLKKKLNGSIMITAKTPDNNQMHVTYTTPPAFEVSRPNLIIQGADPAKPQEKEIWITSNYDDKLQIESITSLKNHMEVIKQESHGNRVKLIVKITPPVPDGKKRYFTDRLEIKISDSDVVLSIRCNGWYARKR